MAHEFTSSPAPLPAPTAVSPLSPALRHAASEPLARPLSELDASYDVVVIGSGYGGAVVAAHLARTQHANGGPVRVCLLERGRERPVGSFPETLPDALTQSRVVFRGREHGPVDSLFVLHAAPVSVLNGCGLGGTSLINAGVALRPDERIWQDPVWPKALADDARRGLAQAFARVERQLGVTTHPKHQVLPKYQRMQRSVEGLGDSARIAPAPLAITFETQSTERARSSVTQPACNDCGNCVTGCNVGAKNTLAMNYLPRARDAGASIFCQVRVDHLAGNADEGYRVFFEPLHQHRALFDASLPFIRAQVVIVAAGVMGTSEILLRSKRMGLACSDQVGARVSGNGDMLAFAHGAADTPSAPSVAPTPVPAPGPSITGVVDRRAGRAVPKGYVLQEGTVPTLLQNVASVALRGAARSWGHSTVTANDPDPDDGRARWLRLRSTGPLRTLPAVLRFVGAAARRNRPEDALDRTQTFLLVSHDAAEGRVELQNNRAVLHMPSDRDRAQHHWLHRDLQQAAEAIAGTYVPLPSARGLSPITVHPLGGAAMAEDARHGATDHSGRLFASDHGAATHPGLYVCDASLFPRSLGVNPLLTIAALADRNARLIAAQQGWTPRTQGELTRLRRRDNNPTTSAERLTFQFTEKLVGHLSGAELEPHAYQRAAAAHRRGDPQCVLVLTIGTRDCQALLDDPIHTASITGSATIACLSAQPLVVSDGTFHLFVDDIGTTTHKQMRYRMRLTSIDGQRYWLHGHKQLSRATGRGLWADTTLLMTDVFRDGEGDGDDNRTKVAQGVLRVTAANFARELTTMRSTDAKGRAALSGIVGYGLTFARGLAQIYTPSLRRPLRRQHMNPQAQPLPHALLHHGHTSLAYSAVSDPLVHTHADGDSAVLYGQIATMLGKRTLVCGDPLCAPQDLGRVLGGFLDAQPEAAFFQVGSATTQALRTHGYSTTQLGIETAVDLRHFTLSGRKLQNLRTAYNRARREGFRLLESSCEEMGIDPMMRICREWLRQKTIARHEIGFFARPIVYVDEPCVRKFFALRGRTLVGFVYLDPMFDNGRVVGYAANILRHNPDAPSGLCDALLVHAALQLQREDMRTLNLGMSPFFRPTDTLRDGAVHDGAVPACRTADAVIELNWRMLNRLFHYRGIAFHKRRWRAVERPVFYAGRPGRALGDFYAAARMTGVL